LRLGYRPLGMSGGLGSAVRHAAAKLKLDSGALQSWVRRQQLLNDRGEPNFDPDWSITVGAPESPPPPPAREALRFTPPPEAPAPALAAQPRSGVRRWLLTSAQDETPVDAAFWNNLLAYGAEIGAQVMVGGFTYQKKLFEDHAVRTGLFVDAVQPYLQHENIACGPVEFVARMNILPTAGRPITDLQTHTRGAWGVYPHAKVQMLSVPALPGKHPAMVMTTGACTVSNYIPRKAGQKAEFHHQIGATIVEVDAAGRAFCRQIGAAPDGSFQDLDAAVHNGVVTRGHGVEAITWGDIHREQIDPTVAMAAWGLDVATGETVRRDGMLDVLRPRHQFFHDLLDFWARNHHRRKDHRHHFSMYRAGTDLVEDEVAACARFLRLTERDWCTSVVVPSNHNDALGRWLDEADFREDVQNAEIYLEANLARYRAIAAGDEAFDVFRWAMARHDPREMKGIIFPPRNGSYLTCEAAGGIENALHGDQGPNGARGSALAFTRVAVRMNVGHSHTASIMDGVYTAGLCGLLDQKYNSGPSSWSHTQIVTYSSARRTLVTVLDGRWRAE
jgi:hypothetical protein